MCAKFSNGQYFQSNQGSSTHWYFSALFQLDLKNLLQNLALLVSKLALPMFR